MTQTWRDKGRARKKLTLTGLRGGERGDVRIGIAHGFIILGLDLGRIVHAHPLDFSESITGVRYALWEGTKGMKFTY